MALHKHEQVLPLWNYGNEKFSLVLQARKAAEEGIYNKEKIRYFTKIKC